MSNNHIDFSEYMSSIKFYLEFKAHRPLVQAAQNQLEIDRCDYEKSVMSEDKVIPVKVALRCRPLIEKEKSEGCQTCLQFVPKEPQVILGENKTFTYDYVFGINSAQRDVYESAVSELIDGIFKGYNATVLAYGQTGSGKTYSMGGGQSVCMSNDDSIMGVIPRTIRALFAGIEERSVEYKFTVKVSYLEIYKEELIDLLCPSSRRDCVAIREDVKGGIKVTGLTELQIMGVDDMIACLDQGSQGRTTGATAMNSQSSRSHAIFTILVDKTHRTDSQDLCTSKFHLVDLAGSERVKKTGAEGERFKEGININKGLLCLGNVISALGDENQKKTHVPYRDSKLTRLLQDSLGGNSHTVMIACVSPADSNFEETLSTLRYADRARKIKNKPVINRDPQAAEILRLRQLVQELQMQGLKVDRRPGDSCSYDDSLDFEKVMSKNKELEEENGKLSRELQQAVDQNADLCEKVILAEVCRDNLRHRMESLREKTGVSLTILNSTQNLGNEDNSMDHLSMVKELHEEIQEIQSQNWDRGTGLTSSTEEESTEEGESPCGLGHETLTKNHALKQAQLGRELQELNKMLAKKEELANQMVQNEGQISAIKEQYEATTKQLEHDVASLQKEKEDLSSALMAAKTNNPLSKVSEQRRKRLQELEQQISQLKKKMTDQAKILKIKEQSEKQVLKLNQDIQSMKQQRVKLVKQMREDAENFRKWKLQKDKEVMQLKAKDRKRDVEVVKMNRKHERQQAVLKRKAEEAAAANKRLKEALQRQKSAAEERFKQQEKHELSGIGARIRAFLSQELEMLISIEEARRHLESLLSDRKMLNGQMRVLRNKLDLPPPAKRRLTNDSQIEAVDDQADKIKEQIKTLEHDIDIGNAQITDLQQKLMDAEEDEKNKSRWNFIHTMLEAKCAMKFLLNVAVAAKVEVAKSLSEQQEMKANYEDVTKSAETIEAEKKRLQHQHDEELFSVKREYEKKVLYLLNHLNNSKDHSTDNSLSEDIRERLLFQEKEIERLSSLQDEVEKKTAEISELSKELTMLKYKLSGGSKKSLMPTVEESFFSPVIMASSKKTKLQIKCGCRKGACSTRLCRCYKEVDACGESCACDSSRCLNRQPEVPQSTTNDEEDKSGGKTFLDTTFDLGRVGSSVEASTEDSCDSDRQTSTKRSFSELENGPERKYSTKQSGATKYAKRSTEPEKENSDTFEPVELELPIGGLKNLKRRTKLFNNDRFFEHNIK